MPETGNRATITVWAFVAADGKTPVRPALGARLKGHIHGRTDIASNEVRATSQTNSVDASNPRAFGTSSSSGYIYELDGTPSGAYADAMLRQGVRLNLERPLDSTVDEDATTSLGDGTVSIAPGATQGAPRRTAATPPSRSGGTTQTRRAASPPRAPVADGELDLAALSEEVGDGTAEAAVEAPPLTSMGVRKTPTTAPAVKKKRKKSRAGLWWVDPRNWGTMPSEEKPKLSIPVGARKDRLAGSTTPPPVNKA